VIQYEYPLSERIRTLLRLEDLFDRALHFSVRQDSHDHHVALVTLFEILDVTSRQDLKSDLYQELERQRATLEGLRGNPNVATDKLDEVVGQLEAASQGLTRMTGKAGQHLRDNEWLMSIKQRTSIPGGVCEFDLPSYHYWLHLEADVRRRHLAEWLWPLLPIRDALAVVLRLLRETGRGSRQVAQQGVFQQMLAGRVAQMLSLKLNGGVPCVPEISANKYALNIRFITPAVDERPKTFEGDVEFELTFYNL
jgi:cell division protein ZapD